MKNLITILCLCLFWSSCGEKTREEIIERYDDGKMKTIMKFIGEGSEEVMIEKLIYSQSGDTLIFEKPLDKIKMVRKYYEDGQIKFEENYKDGNKDVKITFYYENGQIWYEQNYKDGNKDGKWTDYWKNGQIERERNYKDGKEDGKWIWYEYYTGLIKREENYKDGRLIEQRWRRR